MLNKYWVYTYFLRMGMKGKKLGGEEETGERNFCVKDAFVPQERWVSSANQLR